MQKKNKKTKLSYIWQQNYLTDCIHFLFGSEKYHLPLKLFLKINSTFYIYFFKEKGLHGQPRLIIFTSNDAHYSIKKLASFEGIGSDNVYLVKTDQRGKMDTNDLEEKIQQSLAENAVPLMVSATIG